MAIVNILAFLKSLYDFPGRKCWAVSRVDRWGTWWVIVPNGKLDTWGNDMHKHKWKATVPGKKLCWGIECWLLESSWVGNGWARKRDGLEHWRWRAQWCDGISLPIFSMSDQEGHNNFSCTPKCPQWPHLYWSYEATYTLKCFLSEIIAKNRFFHCERWKISFSRFSRKVSI